MTKILLFLTLFSLTAPFYSVLFAQDDLETKSQEELDNFEQIKVERLKRIRGEIAQLESEVYALGKQLKTEDDVVQKAKAEYRLTKAREELNSKYFKFIETATNYHLDRSKDVIADEKRDLWEDVKELLSPMFKTLQNISERPRKIQKYQEDLQKITERLEQVDQAKKKMEEIPQTGEYKSLGRSVKTSLSTIEKLNTDLNIQKEDIQFQLLKLEQAKGSFVEEATQIIFSFISTKGKNLLLAIVIFLFVSFAIKRGRNRFISLLMIKANKSTGPENVSWLLRPLKVIYDTITFGMAFFSALLTLYVLNDWVLVTFILFAIGAIFWSSKQYFPLFVEQTKLMLNLGTVRENERVIYKGIPWKLKRLGYYCRLENPALSGGQVRISSKVLMDHHSRPIDENEQWFPSSAGDWLELDNGQLVRVIRQTPDHVFIRYIGGHHRTYTTENFLSLEFINLSQGFGIEFIFGVDYSLQSKITTEVEQNFQNGLSDRIKTLKQNDKFDELKVSFAQANASSLDFRIFLKCDGEMASQKRMLTRLLQSYCVEICNDHGYIIPFNQLTVTMQNE